MYVRGSQLLRKAFPKDSGHFLPLVGPSSANEPSPQNAWFNNFLKAMQKSKSAAPDYWNWHLEGGGNNDPVASTATMRQLLQQYGLGEGLGSQNNEYGSRVQQRPGYGA